MDASRLLAVARKEWIQLKRDPRSMILAFALPVFLLVFFGYAISWDVDDIRLAVLDRDRTPQSRSLVEAFESSGYFTVAARLDRYGEAEPLLDKAQVLGVLVVPPGFSRDLARGGPAEVQLLLDGSDANTATIALNYGQVIVSSYSAQALLAGRRMRPGVSPELRTWYNPSLESRHMIVPGLIAVIMSIIAAMLTALTIAREWERGTMEQLASTPVRRVEVVLGKLLPYLLIGLFDVVVTVATGMAIFGTPLKGSVPLLAIMTFLFLVGALGFGIFISAVLRSQMLATQVAMVATYLPAILLSGFLFDIDSMPRILQAITYLVPARYYITVTRGIFLKDVGLDVLWVDAAFMTAFAVLGLGLATRIFRKEIG